MPCVTERPRLHNRRPPGPRALRIARSSDPIRRARSVALPAGGSEMSAVGDDSSSGAPGVPGVPARDERPVTLYLHRVRDGDVGAANELARLVYDDLKRIAVRAGARLPKTPLDVTEVAHEAWLRLFGGEPPTFADRRHLFAAAARAMRCVLIDAVRADGRQRADGDGKHVPFEDFVDRLSRRVRDPVALNDELTLLAQRDPEVEELVNLHLMLDFTMEECAAFLGVSLRTLERHWRFAKAWLHERLEP